MRRRPGSRTAVAVVAAALSVAALAASLSTTAQASAVPDPLPALSLPAPTGPHPVGATTVHLTDPNRADPWVPTERRELMLTLWYPASRPGGPRQPYVTPAESEVFLRTLGVTGVPADLLTTMRTHAAAGAAPLPRPHGLPLVVLSPGISLPRSSLTALGEDLASRGYVVAAVDHNHEAIGISFPDGRLSPCKICETRPDGPVATASRAKDVAFVIDSLTGRRSPWRGSWVIDRHRIGMAGHSLGGAATLATMLADGRVRAGVNLDGPYLPALDTDLRRPFLMVGITRRGPGLDPAWDQTWTHLTGWRRWLTVEGADHNSFTDYAFGFGQLGLETPEQTFPGERGLRITRTYVAAFFDLHLRHRPQPLLDRPARRYPEVRFQP